MADRRFQFVEADEKVKLIVTCTDTLGAPISLVGATINLRWRTADGTIVNKAMTLEDAPNGVVSYIFEAAELEPPTMEYEVTATKLDGTIITSLDSEILGVRARLTA